MLDHRVAALRPPPIQQSRCQGQFGQSTLVAEPVTLSYQDSYTASSKSSLPAKHPKESFMTRESVFPGLAEVEVTPLACLPVLLS